LFLAVAELVVLITVVSIVILLFPYLTPSITVPLNPFSVLTDPPAPAPADPPPPITPKPNNNPKVIPINPNNPIKAQQTGPQHVSDFSRYS